MAKFFEQRVFEQKINNFSGGISDSPRDTGVPSSAMVKHFDIHSDNRKLIPYRSTENDMNDGSTATGMKQYDVRHFTLGSNGNLYGLGKNASGYPKIVSKTAANLLTGNWTLNATAEGNAARILGAFIEWQNAFWFFEGTTSLSKWTIGSTVTDAVATVGTTIATVAQGVVGSDNNLYMFYNNKVVRVSSAGAVTDDVFQLPSDMRIVSAARYGTYIAIGLAYGTTATAGTTGRSMVILWDMASTTVPSDIVDWGEGELTCLGNVEGRLVGITNKYLETATGQSSLAVGNGSLVIKMWAGGIPQVVKELVANQAVTRGRMLKDVVIKNNKMYFVASVPLNQSTATESTYHLGIWCFGRKNVNSNFTLTLDQIDENIDTSNFYINSFGAAGNYWFINHSADFSITRTNDAATYSFTSIYETQIFNGGDASTLMKLLGVTVTTAPLPTAGQIVLKYRVDEETDWTTIFTHGTDNSLSHSAVNIESTGDNLPHFREIQLRLESTGGAEPTSISFKAEEVETKLY